MLTIRDEQIALLRRAAARRFEDQCVALVRDGWAMLYASWSEARIRAEVQALLSAGPGWGFKSERDLYRMINVACMLDLGFSRRGTDHWAVPMLAANGPTIDAKIEAVIAGFERDRGVCS